MSGLSRLGQYAYARQAQADWDAYLVLRQTPLACRSVSPCTFFRWPVRETLQGVISADTRGSPGNTANQSRLHRGRICRVIFDH